MQLAMVTGPSSGIGKATTLELARRGYHVAAAGRSAERTALVIDQIVSGGGSAEYLALDLASLDSARDAAHAFVDSGRSLDLLVNNAGVGGGRGTTENGFEVQFGVNHLGHFMLTHHLRDAFHEGTRVVQVTSAAHFNSDGIDFDRVTGKTHSLFGWSEYSTSKLANVLFVRELARRRPDLRTYAVHPGVTSTNLFPAPLRLIMRRRMLNPEQGAETVVWCATAEEVSDETGLYYRHKESVPPSVTGQNDALARELWERSETWCGIGNLD